MKEQLKDFAANIYEAFSQPDVPSCLLPESSRGAPY